MIPPFSHRQPSAGRSRPPAVMIWLVIVATLLIRGVVVEQNAYCQDSPGASPPEGAAASEVDQDQVRQLTEDLRSDQFTIRELASERIFVMGHTVLPMLRDCRRKSSDVEQIDRLDHIIEALAEQDLETRIHNFLKGGDADLDNWPEVEKWFGDSPRVRELFVDLYREHPYLVESLGGTPQQLSIGLSRVRRTLIERGVGAREMPQRIDLLALLLPMSEPNFDAGPQYDAIVVTILQSYQANDLRNDVAFSKPFMRMMAGWMTDSDINVREQVLRLALQWKMDIGLNLALETLKTNPDPILLCRCIQTISRQGNRDHLVLLSHYVNDPTVVFRGRYRGISSGEVQVGDVAAAAIAVLSSVPVTQIGFAEPAEHEVFGIIFEELVVPQKAIPEPDNGTEKEDASDGKKADQPDEQPAEFVPPGFGVQPRTIEEIQELRRQNERRAAARIEIHAKAMALVPEDDTRLPAQSPEAQSPEKS